MARRINTMYDWGTPEEMEARRWLTGEYLDQAGYQNPNDRMNRGELPKTYKAEMALNNAANKQYLEWVQNTLEGQEFAKSQGSPMYAQRIENTPRPTTKLGPIELPSGVNVEKAPKTFEERNIERDKWIDKALKANEKVSPSNSAGARNMSKFWNAGMKYSDGKTLLPFDISPSIAARIGYGIPSLVNDLFVASVPVTLYADMAYNKYRDYQNNPTEEAVRVLQNEGASDEEIRAYLANNFAYDDNPNHE